MTYVVERESGDARIEDVQAVARPVLGHRIVTTFTAEAEGVTTKDVVKRLIDEFGQIG